MARRFPFLPFLAILLFWSAAVPGMGGESVGEGPAVGDLSRPQLDFGRQVLTVWGLGGTPWEAESPYEEEKSRAWMNALHQGYEAMLGVPLMEGSDVRQALQMNPALKARLGMVLLSAPKKFYETDSAGLMRCRLEIPFFGPVSLRSALYLSALRPQPMESLALLASWSTLATATSLPDEPGGPEVKRLVLDLRQTGFEPSLFPRFFSEEGHLLFQEAQIPGPDRFSRPTIRFTRNIEEVGTDLADSDLRYVAARVPPLSHRDVMISSAEEAAFLAFCRRLTADPQSSREILVVYGTRRFFGGLLPKATTAPAADKGAKPGAKPPRPRR